MVTLGGGGSDPPIPVPLLDVGRGRGTAEESAETSILEAVVPLALAAALEGKAELTELELATSCCRGTSGVADTTASRGKSLISIVQPERFKTNADREYDSYRPNPACSLLSACRLRLPEAECRDRSMPKKTGTLFRGRPG